MSLVSSCTAMSCRFSTLGSISILDPWYVVIYLTWCCLLCLMVLKMERIKSNSDSWVTSAFSLLVSHTITQNPLFISPFSPLSTFCAHLNICCHRWWKTRIYYFLAPIWFWMWQLLELFETKNRLTTSKYLYFFLSITLQWTKQSQWQLLELWVLGATANPLTSK